jgi:putative addiction module component (TIGR02574 family)
MDKKSILKEALNLRPAKRLQLIEWLTHSLSKPDEKIEQMWAEESEKRYKALKEGKLKSFPLSDIKARYK